MKQLSSFSFSLIVKTALLTVVLGIFPALNGVTQSTESLNSSDLIVGIGMSDSPKFIYDLMQTGPDNWRLPKKNAYVIDEVITTLFVVENYQRDTQEHVNVTSAFEFLKPDGSLMFSHGNYSATKGKPPASSTWGIMDPALDIGFDDTDTPGTHLLRITVTDHVSGNTATAQVPLMLVRDVNRKKLLNTVIDDAKILDNLWADYAKHKDDLSIRRIESVLHWEKEGSGMSMVIGAAARISLTQRARQDETLQEIYNHLLAQNSATNPTILKEILQNLEKAKSR